MDEATARRGQEIRSMRYRLLLWQLAAAGVLLIGLDVGGVAAQSGQVAAGQVTFLGCLAFALVVKWFVFWSLRRVKRLYRELPIAARPARTWVEVGPVHPAAAEAWAAANPGAGSRMTFGKVFH